MRSPTFKNMLILSTSCHRLFLEMNISQNGIAEFRKYNRVENKKKTKTIALFHAILASLITGSKKGINAYGTNIYLFRFFQTF